MAVPRVTYIILGAALVVGLVLASAQKKPANREPQPNPGVAASPEQNKIVARRVFDDLFTQGRYGEINQIYASNCTVHFGNRTEGLAQAVEEGKGWRSAAPDLVMTADQITVNGDIVSVSWTARGTHTGAGHGLKPTGRKVFIRGTSRFRLENGKIVEAWNSEYRDELFRQIGVSKPRAFVYETALELRASLSELFSGSAP
jgi:predicted ester cyclase